MLELVGWAGAVLLAVCGVPQAVHSFKHKHSFGLTWTFLLMWLIGEVLTLLYVLPTGRLPLLFNYAANIAAVGVIVYYKLRPGVARDESIYPHGRG
jgi:uncharacterized protein with PQ loop repeat